MQTWNPPVTPSVTGVAPNLVTSHSTTVILHQPAQSARDPDFDWVPPIKDEPPAKLGRQCGECGMKFEYNKSYGFHCSHYKCPMGYGGF